MNRAVLDANLCISALIRSEGIPALILGLLFEKNAFESVVTSQTLSELREAIGRPRMRRHLSRPPEEAHAWVDILQGVSIVVEVSRIERVVQADPGDDVYIAAAIKGNAGFIVTGDVDLLALREHRGIRIVPPRQFLNVLEQPLQDRISEALAPYVWSGRLSQVAKEPRSRRRLTRTRSE